MILKTDGVDVDMVMIDWYTGLRGRVMSNLWVELAEQRRTRLSRVNSHHIFSSQIYPQLSQFVHGGHACDAGHPGHTATNRCSLCLIQGHA